MVSIRTIFLSFQMINCVGRYLGYTIFFISKQNVFKFNLSMLTKQLISALFYAYNMLSKIECAVMIPQFKRSMH